MPLDLENRRRYHRNRLANLLAKGICPNHALDSDRRVVPGLRKCAECRAMSRLSRLRVAGVPESEVERARIAIENFDGRCQSCGSTSAGHGKKDFSLDHDHATFRFRGIICNACNTAIGQAKESLDRLLAIVRYLQA